MTGLFKSGLIFTVFCCHGIHFAYGQEQKVDPANAFERFWNAKEIFELKQIEKAKSSVEEDTLSKKQLIFENAEAAATEHLSALSDAEDRYESELDQNNGNEKNPFLVFNLAQVLYLKSKNSIVEKRPGASEELLRRAQKYLSEFYKLKTGESLQAEALLLEGRIDEILNEPGAAFLAWNKVAKDAPTSVTAVYARIAAGDLSFKLDRYVESNRLYQDALNAAKSNLDIIDINQIRYRAAWSAYRSGNLDLAMLYSKEILTSSVAVDAAVLADSSQILGEVLFEKGKIEKTKEILLDKNIGDSAGTILVEVIRQYLSQDAVEKAKDLAEFGASRFPLDRALPEILMLLAGANHKMDNKGDEAAALEEFGMLLPKDSLWRIRMAAQNRLEYILAMEPVAIAACEEASAFYYDAALKSGSAEVFLRAARILTVLVPFLDNSSELIPYKLRLANSYYFAGQYSYADRLYEELLSKYKINEDLLNIALYQAARSKYGMLQEKLENIKEAQSIKRKRSPKIAEALAYFESGVEQFANKYVNSAEASELLLLAAGANRDLGDLKKANLYWKRVLLQKSLPSYRTLAMRGTLATALNGSKPEQIIDLSKRYLRLEDLKALDSSLESEILGILSTSIIAYAEDLKKKGKMLESGAILVDVATEFSAMPNREEVWRNGAYTLAVGNDWNSAIGAAENYFINNLKEYSDDMNYLLARGKETQIRFGDAAQLYLKQARLYPKHRRALSSVERSEQLFLAEDDLNGAANAAEASATLSSQRDLKIEKLSRAYQYLLRANELAHAKAIALKIKAIAVSSYQVLSAQMMIAKMSYKKDSSREQAVKILASIINRAKRDKAKIGKESFSELVCEAQYLIAQDHLDVFYDYHIGTRSGTIASRVAKKMTLYKDFKESNDEIIKLQNENWVPQARYLAGESADKFSSEIKTMLKTQSKGLSDREKDRYKEMVQSLANSARKNHSENIISMRQSNTNASQSLWGEKSMQALSYSKEDAKQRQITEKLYFPKNVGDLIPKKWRG